ncbi:Phage-related baseplate assembly protein [Vibrio aerogenes CECT 7868]|uniref:Phage-related baseplate assembly protein n=1 Tax=Vibrio aerogenes CECT 7868 TaxID=1216006 RepID=A0A1M5YWR0_9VIBR|nr:type VI secretion system tip protein TssI/VgrG [Vibrio aerogenes]SHI16461.1 Phage-related baseplate assembly protein [Vibrio aerogenes CECT 7868]
MNSLNFRLTVDGVDDETLVVRDYQGVESVSDSVDSQGNPVYGYRYQIALASRSSGHTAKKFVDSKALLEVIRRGEVVQKVHGIIRSFGKGDTGHQHTFYDVVLVPSLERLSLRQNSRIFQQQSVPDMLSILLQEMSISDYAFSVKRTCAPREFCVQYRETDLEFFHRLMAEEGLTYTFEHEDSKHTIVIADNPKGFRPIGAVPYNVISGGVSDTPYIASLTETRQSQVNKVQMQDYSFKKPAYSFMQTQEKTGLQYQLETYEHYDYPGRYKDDGNGVAFSKIRLDWLRRNELTVTGHSDEAKIQGGVRFDVTDHTDGSMNKTWLAVKVVHTGSQPQALEENGSGGETSYHNEFFLIPGEKVWQTPPRLKPVIDGPNVALVVGPPGEEIFCDEHGRVKLHFPWDRYSNADDKSSCWVRVSHEWAGAEYGMVMLPRIGHEVIVSFLNGDPDQPIVTGRTYNANNKAPYPLPDAMTKTVLRTESHQGSGFNELSFEDQSGSEKIYLHGQKDYVAVIENDVTGMVGNDQHLTVENNRFSHIKVNDHLTIDGEQRTKVTKMISSELAADLHQKVGSLTAVESGKVLSLKSGTKIVIEAGSQITLKAGGSFLTVASGGVDMSGPAINLNKGGSAGSVTAYGGQAAELPGVPEVPDPPAPILTPAQVATMKSAAPFCEECEKCKGGVCSV